MKKTLSTIALLLLTTLMWAQSPQETFSTKKQLYTEEGWGEKVLTMNVNWEVHNDSLIMMYMDRRIQKQLYKQGISPKIVYVYPFKKEMKGNAAVYTYKDEEVRFTIIVGPEHTSVKRETKDSFTDIVSIEFYH